ncbi:AraC family transcriptional regulator [Streptacidiphilus pinicola]|uniref:AraC family transcriptional regulator n=1 Tax=Streptacidiphilus pinicola TaxID=2219663 RepID=A0A2X0J0E9_9ACTN|nr:helix-turn-helix domain-containing protein [Streptacidiphilus pinicola]RAG80768.1 AraC family transcriptional regulator [Streptacidiphilus pinicola]
MSAAEVSVSDRFDWFVDAVSSALMPSTMIAENPGGFYAEGGLLNTGPVQVSRFSYSPLRSRRTPRLIRRGDPEQYQLALVTRGTAWFAQDHSEAEIRAGGMVLWDTSRPYESASGLDGRDVEAFVLQIPKERMALPSQQVDRLLAQRIPAGTGVGAILSQFLVSLADNGPDCRPQELAGLGNMAVELAASCLTQQLGTVREQPAELRAHVLLRRINTFIEHNLADPELTPRAIADHHHISLRTLYLLFQNQEESVAATIRRRRLEHCHADLANPRLRDQPVHAIAARWGFTQPAAFSRAFRTTYCTTPTEHRHHSPASQ